MIGGIEDRAEAYERAQEILTEAEENNHNLVVFSRNGIQASLVNAGCSSFDLATLIASITKQDKVALVLALKIIEKGGMMTEEEYHSKQENEDEDDA